jgi:hypothetical protein
MFQRKISKKDPPPPSNNRKKRKKNLSEELFVKDVFNEEFSVYWVNKW